MGNNTEGLPTAWCRFYKSTDLPIHADCESYMLDMDGNRLFCGLETGVGAYIELAMKDS